MNNHLKFALFVYLVQFVVHTLLMIILIPLVSMILAFSGFFDLETLTTNTEHYSPLIQNIFIVVFAVVLFVASYLIFKILYKKFRKSKNLVLHKAIGYSTVVYGVINLIFSLPSKENNYIALLFGIFLTYAAFYLGGRAVEEKS